jgi:hypothetical protein
MINILTGRKSIAFPSGHTAIMSQRDQREIDQALILYSNNTEVRKQLIAKYEVKYLFWMADWLNLEYTFSNNQISFFDPLEIMDTPENRGILNANGIFYLPTYDTISPNVRGQANLPRWDVLMVIPNNNIEQPWASGLNLTLLKEFYTDNQTIARMFSIK